MKNTIIKGALTGSGAWVLILILLLGCNGQKHLSKKTDLFHDKFEQGMAKKCGEWYPPVTSTKTTTTVTQGKPDTVHLPGETQYITVDCDSAVAAAKSGKAVVKVPYTVHDIEYIHVTDTVKQHDTTVVVNNAELKSQTLRADKAENTLSGVNQKARMNFWWAIIATAIIVVRLALKYIFKI